MLRSGRYVTTLGVIAAIGLLMLAYTYNDVIIYSNNLRISEKIDSLVQTFTGNEANHSGINEASRSGINDATRSGIYDVTRSGITEVNRIRINEAKRSGINEAKRSGRNEASRSGINEANRSGINAVNRSVIRILYASKCFSDADWSWGVGSAPLETCPHLIGRCEFTSDMSLANESHALLFHMRNPITFPKFRPPQQKWIFALRESPVHTYKNLKHLQNVFNLTMTYLLSAENNVDWSYGSCLSKTDNSRLRLDGHSGTPSSDAASAKPLDVNYASGKKHLVAWFVSNCHTPSRREQYVKEMQKYADIHIYGCGPYRCPKSKGEYCYSGLLKNDYKFYLSFENSFCNEYVTKKLWHVLSVDIVPVVLGHANYSHWLPAHSYIDVRDFDSPRHLVDYLKRLDADDALYNEYFRWKSQYSCDIRSFNNACELCRYLHETKGRQQRVDDMVTRWDRKKNCLTAGQFYRTLGVSIGT